MRLLAVIYVQFSCQIYLKNKYIKYIYIYIYMCEYSILLEINES